MGNRLSRGTGERGNAPPPPNETLPTGFSRLMYLPTQDLCQQVDSHSLEVARSVGEGSPGRRSWGRKREEREGNTVTCSSDTPAPFFSQTMKVIKLTWTGE